MTRKLHQRPKLFLVGVRQWHRRFVQFERVCKHNDYNHEEEEEEEEEEVNDHKTSAWAKTVPCCGASTAPQVCSV